MAHTPIILADVKGMDRKEWLTLRRNGLGGSDVAILYGLHPFGRTLWDLWRDKTGKTIIKDEPFNLTTSIGHALEPLIAQQFTAITGWRTYRDTNMYRHPKHPWMLANLDFLIDFGNGKRGILECKTTAFFNQEDWKDGGIPYNYELQVRHYMAVMDIDVVYICCLFDNNPDGFIKRRIERNLMLENDIIEKGNAFWKTHVLANKEPEYIEPATVALKSLKEYIATLKEEPPMTLDSRLYLKALNEILALNVEKSRYSALVKNVGEQISEKMIVIQKAIGSAESATCGSLTLSYTSRNTTSWDKDKLKLKYPTAYDEVVSSNTSKTLVIRKYNSKKALKTA